MIINELPKEINAVVLREYLRVKYTDILNHKKRLLIREWRLNFKFRSIGDKCDICYKNLINNDTEIYGHYKKSYYNGTYAVVLPRDKLCFSPVCRVCEMISELKEYFNPHNTANFNRKMVISYGDYNRYYGVIEHDDYEEDFVVNRVFRRGESDYEPVFIKDYIDQVAVNGLENYGDYDEE